MSSVSTVWSGVFRRCQRIMDDMAVRRLQSQNDRWRCRERRCLVVGCESSGTTAISHLLLRGAPGRFLREGYEQWVWDLYKSVYQGHTRVCDWPRLRLFQNIKVPGFAAILPQFLEEFPNTRVVYVVRDPRDVVASAYKTWKVKTRDGLASIPWVAETWLGIEEQDPVARLALRWKTYLARSSPVPGLIFVRYEDFCADKVRCIASLASNLGLPVDLGRIRRLCDQQASDADARDYRPEGPGAGRREPLLSDGDRSIIEDICGPQMQQWHYLEGSGFRVRKSDRSVRSD